MKKAKKLLAVSVMTLTAGVISGQAQAFNWSDTFIGYRYGSEFTEPGNTNDIRKNVLTLGHASGYDYGQNFFNLDMLQSDKKDAASGSDNGATEFYLTYRHQLYISKLLDADFSFGPVKDVSLTAGFDLNTKNTAFAPRKRMFVVGPTFKMDVPGFMDVSFLAAYETNHCGLSACGAPGNTNDIDFDPYYLMSIAWGIPFEIKGAPLRFQGFANFISSKGDNNFGNETKPETLIRPALMLDVGRYVLGRDNTLRVGVGYEYWRNKFGNPSGPGIDTDAWTLNAQWHF
ncbi:hypothetical protein [Nitrincola sp.]|uniref:hypothetical protein n=1 Tax=Nitrincola sp. TaxID=1926584 RepID=UPI003A90D519